jgi:hypothetical protein
MICQQVTLSGDAEWPKVADAVIEASGYMRAVVILELSHEIILANWGGSIYAIN